MPEEVRNLGVRQSPYLSPSDRPSMSSEQYVQEGVTEIAHLRSPELLRRALLRARENIQNKENIIPEKPGSQRRRRRRAVFTARSPLPADYPRAPLQDITHYAHALQRARRQRFRTTPTRQLLIQRGPLQEIPLQGHRVSVVALNPGPEPDNQSQSVVPSRIPLLEEGIVAETSISVHSIAGLQQENQVPNITPMRTSSLSNSPSGRVFGTVLQQGPENDRNKMGPEDSTSSCVSQKSNTTSRKSLMKMR